MHLTSSHPFWSVANGLINSYPALESDKRCDALVAGGGISGALIAFHLAQAGIDTVLIDRRDIGTGSTCASTALLQYEIDVPLCELQEMIGKRDAGRAYLLCHGAIEKLAALAEKYAPESGFRMMPSLFLARFRREERMFRREYELRKELGINLQYWGPEQIRKHYPFERPAALFSENGAQVDPHRLTHALLAAAERMGLRIHDRTTMQKTAVSKRHITVTTDRDYRIQARHLIIATGFEAKILLGRDAGKLKSTYALISEPMNAIPGWFRKSLIWESGSPYLYLRTTPEGRIIVGGEDEEFVNPKRRDKLISKKSKILVRKFQALFPDIDLQVAYEWAGTFGETGDGLAYIGPHSRFPKTSFALGYGGNGITYSIIAAEIVRDHFLGKSNPDARLFRFGR